MSDNRRNATLKALIDAAITELMIKTSGEQIYLDDQTTLSSKMAEMVAAINLRDKKTDVDGKIKTVTDSLNSTSESLGNDISTLRSEKADKTEVDEKVNSTSETLNNDISTLESNTNTKLETKADKTALGDLAAKDKVAKDDLDTALQTELDAKATTADVDTKISALQSSSDTKFSDTDKAINLRPTQTEVTEQIAALKQEIMGDLPVEAYDTFTELATYIEEHQEAANALTAAVGNKADKSVVDDILTVINGLGALAKKDKVAKDDLDASLQTELDAKATTEAMNTALATKSNTSHTHDDRYYTESEIDTKLDTKSNTGHKHTKADISDFPTSMPASDVPAWAKASTKPSYTKSDVGLGNVGNFKAVSTVANQGLTDAEKANARSNIGAGASSFSGKYSDLSGTPTLGTAAAKNVGDFATTKTLTNEDLNSIITPGFYNAGGANTVTNKPSGVNEFGLIVTHNASGSYYTQILYYSADSSSYRRYCNNDTWGSWIQEKLTDTTYSDATTSAHGLMTAAMVTKLNDALLVESFDASTGTLNTKSSS